MTQLERMEGAIAALAGELAAVKRLLPGDMAVLTELCRLKGWTLAQVMDRRRQRDEAMRALRPALSAGRVARLFRVSRRQVQNICAD